jgi:hypothetical protein
MPILFEDYKIHRLKNAWSYPYNLYYESIFLTNASNKEYVGLKL